MTISNDEKYRNNYFDQILKIEPDFQSYYDEELKHLRIHTQINNLKVLSSFFSLVKNFTPEEIKKYFSSDKFIAYNNDTKNLYSNMIAKWLRFKGIEIKLKRYKTEYQELDKNVLITRSDLNKILKVCSVKKRALIMVNYEGALRRKELLSIRFKDIQYNESEGIFNLYVQQSKSIKRNIGLVECIPFLRDYYSLYQFEPDDLIFEYAAGYISVMYNRIIKRAKINKRFYPHILRHSRLTELATTKLNEPQLRRFAGWSRSSTMAERYIHLDDADVRRILYGTNNKEIKLIDFENPIDDVLKLRESHISELTNIIGFMSKFLLSLDESFREATDDSYVPKADRENDAITFSVDEMKEFREKVKSLLKKE